jgi:hypothetical protein
MQHYWCHSDYIREEKEYQRLNCDYIWEEKEYQRLNCDYIWEEKEYQGLNGRKPSTSRVRRWNSRPIGVLTRTVAF